MAYVIAEPCIGVKDTACVDACPVDCIHPKKNTTYEDSRRSGILSSQQSTARHSESSVPSPHFPVPCTLAPLLAKRLLVSSLWTRCSAFARTFAQPFRSETELRQLALRVAARVQIIASSRLCP
jgi:NAD-dependent dihydropyrimidine dehydrogenase PreA subunit